MPVPQDMRFLEAVREHQFLVTKNGIRGTVGDDDALVE